MTMDDLKGLRELHRERQRIRDRMDQLRASVQRTSPNLDGMPHGGQQRDIMAEYAANFEDAIRTLGTIEQRLTERIDMVEMGIRDANLPPRETAVIWCRFVEGMSIGQVSHELNYSRSRTYDLYKMALQRMFGKDRTQSDRKR